MKSYKIVLASGSPRRKELLSKIDGIDFIVIPSNADESITESEKAEDIVVELAERKAESVFSEINSADFLSIKRYDSVKNYSDFFSIVLGADTLVSADGKILSKPKDITEAETMFKMLCGRTHEVVTGICFISKLKKVKFYKKTYVTFGAFNDKIVYNYINLGLCYDKAGGYGIQDKELSGLIKKIDGDINNVIGLPDGLFEILKENF